MSNIRDFTDAGSHPTMLDEDTMSSDSATNTASQQSVKAYVDTQDATKADLAGSGTQDFAAQDLTARDVTASGPVVLPSYAVAGVPTASSYTGGMIYVTDDVGGAVTAFSDGTNWRRTTDRAVVSTT